MKRAALFDMDRTLVRRETASLYVRYQRDRGEASLRDSLQVLFWVAQYTFGVVDAPEVATRVFRSLKGTAETTLVARCEEWFHAYVTPHVCERGRRAVDVHKARGDVVAIVTGGLGYAARPLANALGIDHVVATELEVDANGLFTGRFIAPLCYGEGKVLRARRFADAHGFRLEDSTFFSDSYTDLPLLTIAREPVIVNPDPRLSRLARARGWPVERW